MAKPWSQVEQSEEYNALPPQQRVEAKKEYFKSVVEKNPAYLQLPAEERISAQKEFFGGRIDDFTSQIQRQNVLGQTLNVPGAAIRSAVMGKGYTQGAIQPDKAPTFQDFATNKLMPKTSNAALNFAVGYPASVAGAGLDLLTQPANLLPGAVSVTGTGKAIGKVAGNVVKSIPGVEKLTTLATTPIKSPFVKKTADEIIDTAIPKAIRPSVAGKQTAYQVNEAKNKAREAVKSIVDNKPNLLLEDANGVKTSKLPENLSEFSDAVAQTRSSLYGEVDNLLNQAGANKLQLGGVAKELDGVIKNTAIALKDPSIVEYAKNIQARFGGMKDITVKDADELIQLYNDSLKAFYKNPSYDSASKASIDALIVNNLRKGLDNLISGLQGPGFAALKSKYGALKSIEKDVVNRSIIDARKNVKGLIDFTDIFSAGDIVRGLATLNPADVAKGGLQIGVRNFYKMLNNPNRTVKNMFADVEKVYQPTQAPLKGMGNVSPVMQAYGLGSTVKKVNPGPKVLGLPSPQSVSKPAFVASREAMPIPSLGTSSKSSIDRPFQIKGINTSKTIPLAKGMALAGTGLLGLSSTANASSKAPVRIDIKKINQIESSGKEDAIGDNGKAFGINQIHEGTLRDFNKANKKNYTTKDLMNKDKNNEVADWYFNKEAPRLLKSLNLPDTVKNRIRIYNQGYGNIKKGKPIPKKTQDYFIKYGAK